MFYALLNSTKLFCGDNDHWTRVRRRFHCCGWRPALLFASHPNRSLPNCLHPCSLERSQTFCLRQSRLAMEPATEFFYFSNTQNVAHAGNVCGVNFFVPGNGEDSNTVEFSFFPASPLIIMTIAEDVTKTVIPTTSRGCTPAYHTLPFTILQYLSNISHVKLCASFC